MLTRHNGQSYFRHYGFRFPSVLHTSTLSAAPCDPPLADFKLCGVSGIVRIPEIFINVYLF